MKFKNVKYLYANAGYLPLSGDELTPVVSGWGGVVEDHQECDAINEVREVWNRQARAIGWHDNHYLLIVDCDFGKAASITADSGDVTLHNDFHDVPDKLHMVESKTDKNMHIPVLVDGLDEATAINSNVSWIDVKGSASFGAPSWSVAIGSENNDGESYRWWHRDSDNYNPLLSDTSESESVPVITTGDVSKLIKLNGESVLSLVPRDKKEFNPQKWDSHDVSVTEILPGVEPGVNTTHPVHGSSTGANFRIDEGRKTWRCMRDHEHVTTGNVTGNAYHMLGMMRGLFECGDWMGDNTPAYADKGEEVMQMAQNLGLTIPSHWERDIQPVHIPLVRSADKSERRDRFLLGQAVKNTRDFFHEELEGATAYHSPQALGKTTYLTEGAKNQKRLIIGANKDEHRDTIKRAADNAGVSWREVINFKPPDDNPRLGSWLWHNAPQPQRDRIHRLHEMGFEPRLLNTRYGHLVPDDATCPYQAQFNNDIETDILMGSVGHESVEHFADDRAVAYDDVQPLSEQVTENTFVLQSHDFTPNPPNARPELDALIREAACFQSDTLDDLLDNESDVAAARRIAIGQPTDDEEHDNVWSELKRRRDADDAERVDLPAIALRSELVDRSTIDKLRCVVRAERRNTEWLTWQSAKRRDGNEVDMTVYSWFTSPDLRDNPVVITSATLVPHAIDVWLQAIGHNSVTHEFATDSPKAVRRGQGILAVKLTENSHSRSGGNGNSKRTRHLKEAIERVEGQAPSVIDSKKMQSQHGLDGTNFARTWSNNKHGEETVGMVAGSTYHGDDWALGLGAACGEVASIEHDGRARSDNEVVSDLMRFMRQAPVSQAITRFGRQKDVDARVYVDTCHIPDDIPTVDVSDRVRVATQTQVDVVSAVQQGASNYKQIGNSVNVTRQQARNVVNSLEDILKIRRREGCGGSDIVESLGIELNIVELPEISQCYSNDGIKYQSDGKDAQSGTVQLGLDASFEVLEPPD